MDLGQGMQYPIDFEQIIGKLWEVEVALCYGRILICGLLLYLRTSPPGLLSADMLVIAVSQSLMAFSWKISKKFPAR